MIAYCYLVLVQARALIAKHEERVALEGVILDGHCRFHDLNPTDEDVPLCAVLLNVSETTKVLEVCLVGCALRAESSQLLLGWLAFNNEDLLYVECCC